MKSSSAKETNQSELKDAKVERNIYALGWVSFFGGMAQDMIQPNLPLFYTTVLGLNKEFIGLIEGSLMGVVSLMKIGAGYISDALGMRKAVVFAGYAFSAVARLLFGFAGSGSAALGLRITDGVGKGLKEAPRDALVAGSAGNKKLGLAFGIQRTLDTLGSVVGPLLSFWILQLWINHPNKYRELFVVAGILAAVPLVIIGFFVRERVAPVAKQRFSWSAVQGPALSFFVVMLIFSLGNSSDAFLILRAQQLGMATVMIPVAYALFNLISALAAIPAGRWSDRIGRRKVIAYSWGVYAVAYFGFALANAAWMVWVLYAFYGLFYALNEGAAKAMVAELVPDEKRGAAYGLFNAAMGLAALPASLLAGWLWTRISPAAPFALGGILALVALAGLHWVPKISVGQKKEGAK
jgi:MFS family permease